jgi:hypothetical protein
MRYRLRTLLILLAVLPPLLAGGWWRYSVWRAEQERQQAIEAGKAKTKIQVLTWKDSEPWFKTAQPARFKRLPRPTYPAANSPESSARE